MITVSRRSYSSYRERIGDVLLTGHASPRQKSEGGPAVDFHAAHGQDKWLLDVIVFSSRNFSRSRSQWTFVEAGAYDGLTGSNVATLEKNYGWRGLCFEPNTNNFDKVVRSRPLCRAVNAILCDPAATRAGTKVSFQQLLSPYDQESGVVDFMDQIKQDRLNSLLPQFKGGVQDLPCHDMSDDVVQFVSADGHVDLLSLDVEGSEYSVLKTIDWNRVHFDIAFVERSHEEDVIRLMEDNQYKHVARVGDDNVFFHADSPYIPLWTEGCTCILEGECGAKLVYPDPGWLNCRK